MKRRPMMFYPCTGGILRVADANDDGAFMVAIDSHQAAELAAYLSHHASLALPKNGIPPEVIAELHTELKRAEAMHGNVRDAGRDSVWGMPEMRERVSMWYLQILARCAVTALASQTTPERTT